MERIFYLGVLNMLRICYNSCINWRKKYTMKKLTFEQYKQKMTFLISQNCISEEALLDAYNEYCSISDEPIINQVEIHLCKNKYFVENFNTKGYFSQFWLRLCDFSKFLLKEIPNNKFFKCESNIYTGDNAMVIPKIIRAMGLESAEYYIIKWVMDDSVETWEDDFLLTPSFLQENDELICFSDIVDKDCVDVIVLESTIRRYLELRHFKNEDIENFIKEFRKTIFMSEFIDNTDISAENIAFIVNDKKIRMAPMYDFDFCAGNEGSVTKHFKVGNDSGIRSIINYYKKDSDFVDWIKKSVMTIDVKKVLSNGFESPNQYMPTKSRIEFYAEFINKQKEIVKSCIDISPQDYGERE